MSESLTHERNCNEVETNKLRLRDVVHSTQTGTGALNADEFVVGASGVVDRDVEALLDRVSSHSL